MPESSGVRVLGWITLAVAALTCGTIAVAIAKAPQRITVAEIEASEAKLDPNPGRHFDLGDLGGAPRLVVALGTCMTCSTSKTDFNLLKRATGYRPVGIYNKGAESERVSGLYAWLEIRQDDAGLAEKLNAYFTPRAYAFRSDGTLVAVQGSKETLERFVSRLGVAE